MLSTCRVLAACDLVVGTPLLPAAGLRPHRTLVDRPHAQAPHDRERRLVGRLRPGLDGVQIKADERFGHRRGGGFRHVAAAVKPLAEPVAEVAAPRVVFGAHDQHEAHQHAVVAPLDREAQRLPLQRGFPHPAQASRGAGFVERRGPRCEPLAHRGRHQPRRGRGVPFVHRPQAQSRGFHHRGGGEVAAGHFPPATSSSAPVV